MLRAKTLAMACLLPCLLQRNMTRYIYSMQREKNPVFLFLIHTFKKYSFLPPFRTSWYLAGRASKRKG